MTSEEIVEKVKSSLGEEILESAVTLGDAVIHIAPESLPKTARFLKEDADLCFDYLSQITGVDYLEQDREPRFEAVYDLHSMDHNHSIRIRIGLPEDEPSVPTVSEIWKVALFPERELFDMFGFAPAASRRSLGGYAILWQIDKAREVGLEYLYLGYWIRGCQKMDYKSEYRPLELYLNNRWTSLL